MSNRPFPARPYAILGILGLIILVGGFGTWSVMSQIAGAIIATGQVEVDQNRQVVQHRDGGVVAEILVDEGDLVAAGDILLRLDPTELNSQLAITGGQLFEFMARRARWEAERDGAETITYPEELVELAAQSTELQELMDGQSRLFGARNDSLAREAEQLEKRGLQIQTQVNGFDAQVAALETQLDLMSRELADQEALLARELVQAARVFALQRELASLEGQRGELIAGKAQAAERITEIEIEALKLETNRREEAITRLRDLQVRELELAEQRRALLTQLQQMDIRAPVSGIVYSMQVFAERAVIQPAEPVLYLIPQDRPLVVAAQVEPIHVDQVFVSQEVVVRFSAFDANSTPELFGSVVQVSADAFVDERTQATYYRAEIRLSEEELSRLPKGLVLVPGMPVETFISTEARTPMAYLMRPLTDYFAKAFREG